ncbi:MAG TPA: tannase/feruloyl esterase family alpha/beta hydrolase [Kofleriaceae bacterium]|jgi:feruloyl esterase|nr:tannase/feruloyl esterase family alpha/beta hydrolase [Kofleriaceae bacterium]
MVALPMMQSRRAFIMPWLVVSAAAHGCSSTPSKPPVDAAPPPVDGAAALRCDESMKAAFKPDDSTTVLLVHAFHQGDPIALGATTGTAPPTAAADLCLVKLNVGPGHPGPAGARSTSAGIGIEVWLPASQSWNKRIHNLGGGGWAGGTQGSTTQIGNPAGGVTAGAEGSVVGTTDTGHSVGDGSFAMNPDGSIDTTLWEDFAERSLHELAVKTRALAAAYYLAPATRAYWDGCSTGGRQGYKEAQNNPADYDGYLAGAPAFNWTKFITNELYSQIVVQRDLGGVALTTAQHNLVSGSAVSACDMVGGQHIGYLLDPQSCHYDPTKDVNVLCAGIAGNGVTGASADPGCVNLAQAQAFNKIWYGQTADGAAPDPATDNASTATLASGQLWWGLMRGSTLLGLAGARPFSIASDMVALEMQNPGLATPSFLNATGNGTDAWKALGYADLATAYARGISLQSSFGNINTDDPDLTRLQGSGAKVLSYHGLADVLIAPQGSINYFTRVADAAGGVAATQAFDRLFLIPGMGHCAGIGSATGVAGPANTANSMPLPVSGQLFAALVDWVENGKAPSSVVLSSADGSVSRPICMYPNRAVYSGTGSVTAAASYACQSP